MARILVLGGGFAGLWAAVAAARKADEIGTPARAVEILLVDQNPYHNIRVRNYEADLSAVAIPLGEILDPIGVKHLKGAVRNIDVAKQQVAVATARGEEQLAYDRLVLALGSQLSRPHLSGMAADIFDVDTYAAAVRLNTHIASLGAMPPSSGRSTVVVVGAGFTGIEVATEMPVKLGRALPNDDHRIILVDPNLAVGTTIGDHARPVICEALSALNIETRLGAKITAGDAIGITLDSGETIPTQTVVWCAGMRPSPLAETLPGSTRDRSGRLVVDEFMRADGLTDVFAAGDVASCLVDSIHSSVMSCQFARPMGRFAGHNAVADLLGQPMLPLRIEHYVTVLDLGSWGALYTMGWDRQVFSTGQDAKVVKQTINRKRIYPPRTGVRDEILAAAAPIIQAPPQSRATQQQEQC
jgi:NADH:ubiquinone reductase (H+-translocating)